MAKNPLDPCRSPGLFDVVIDRIEEISGRLVSAGGKPSYS
jgi:hypothetical protein